MHSNHQIDNAHDNSREHGSTLSIRSQRDTGPSR
jgi:hypothetical protein